MMTVDDTSKLSALKRESLLSLSLSIGNVMTVGPLAALSSTVIKP
jgi:hypothetical protein